MDRKMFKDIEKESVGEREERKRENEREIYFDKYLNNFCLFFVFFHGYRDILGIFSFRASY